MNRVMTVVNLMGVLTVGIVCVLQWKLAHHQEGQLDELSRIREQQAAQIQTQTQSLKDNAADLADLRERQVLAEDQLKGLQDRIAALIAERDGLRVERDQLSTSLKEWKKASADRDQTIEQLQTQQQQVTAARDEAIVKFNELAAKYNKLVQLSDHK